LGINPSVGSLSGNNPASNALGTASGLTNGNNTTGNNQFKIDGNIGNIHVPGGI